MLCKDDIPSKNRNHVVNTTRNFWNEMIKGVQFLNFLYYYYFFSFYVKLLKKLYKWFDISFLTQDISSLSNINRKVNDTNTSPSFGPKNRQFSIVQVLLKINNFVITSLGYRVVSHDEISVADRHTKTRIS